MLVAGALAAAALLSTAALIEFYAHNAGQLEGPARVIRYAEAALWILVFGTALVKALFPRLQLWRAILAVGLGVFVFSCYDEFKALQKTMQWPMEEWLPLFWISLSLAVVLIAIAVLRRPAAVTAILIFSLVFAAPSVARVVVIAADEYRAPPRAQTSDEKHLRFSPNIYWIVLDGYPRGDVLRQDFGFDNSPFLDSLTRLGFTVLERSLSNFPSTVQSISSTLNMDYTVRPNGEATQPYPMRDMYPIVKGNSRTVAQLKAAGYNYVHFENGYDYLTKCAEGEQRCVHGSEGLDEEDVAILSNTPIIDLINQFESKGSKVDMTAAFDIGGVEELRAKLAVIQEVPAPFFAYAHVIAPHPPIRFRADCSMRPARPDLTIWDAKVKEDFIEQLKCVNVQAALLLQAIVSSDPKAIVIVQSDHGTAFNGQFAKRSTEWSDADLQERFGTLNAMRLPATCDRNLASDLTLVDTFPLVFACLTGEEFKRHPPRFFVTPYDNSPEFGRAVEYAPERLRKGP